MLHVAFFCLSLALQSAFWWNFHSCLAVLLIFPHTTGWPGASAFAWEIPTLNPPRFTKFQPGKCREFQPLGKRGPLIIGAPLIHLMVFGSQSPFKGLQQGTVKQRGRGPTIPACNSVGSIGFCVGDEGSVRHIVSVFFGWWAVFNVPKIYRYKMYVSCRNIYIYVYVIMLYHYVIMYYTYIFTCICNFWSECNLLQGIFLFYVQTSVFVPCCFSVIFHPPTSCSQGHPQAPERIQVQTSWTCFPFISVDGPNPLPLKGYTPKV